MPKQLEQKHKDGNSAICLHAGRLAGIGQWRWEDAMTAALILTLGLAVTAPLASDPPTRKPNILFIVCDDLNDNVGCYGHPLVKTPNIDRLASRGVRFDRAYCQDPICNPSRTSFLSGRRPQEKLQDVVWLPHHLQQHGYFTIEHPKVAHSYGTTRTAIQWDAVIKGGTSPVIAAMKEHRDRPFFLGVGLQQTHDAVHEKKYLALYPLEKITWPNEPPAAVKDLPAIALTRINVSQTTDEERRQALARYYASITTLDAEVGRLLDALDELKLSERTIIVFTSDHGKHKGEHGGIWDKRTLFEVSVRVPLIVAAPGIKGGTASPRLVELVDLYPTLAELCGLPAPASLQGTSFVPLLREPDRAWKKAAFSFASVNRGRSVRTERYRYSEWDEGKAALLYDYQTDPHEFRNLANDPAHQETVAQLRAMLQAGWRGALPVSAN
jgi:uncharacterized sulfatase